MTLAIALAWLQVMQPFWSVNLWIYYAKNSTLAAIILASKSKNWSNETKYISACYYLSPSVL